MRFVAILSVMVFHSYMYFFPPLQTGPIRDGWSLGAAIIHTGWFGVQLFFVISGFILAIPFASQHLLGSRRVGLKKYFIRRVTRLEPPFIIHLTLMLMLMVAFCDGRMQELLPHYLANATYSHNMVYDSFSPINSVTWTLEIEVQFYILAPLLATVFIVRRNWLRRGILAVAILGSTLQYFYLRSDMLNQTIVGQIRYFLLGFLLADIYLTVWRSKATRSFVWDVIGVAAWAMIPVLLRARLFEFVFTLGGTTPWDIPDFGLLTTLLVAPVLLIGCISAFRGRFLGWFFLNPWIAVTGGMCYTIYLYHTWLLPNIKIHLFGKFDLVYSFGNAALCAVAILLVLVISAVLFVFLEKPFMRRDWPQRLWRTITNQDAVLIPAVEEVVAFDPDRQRD